VVISQVYGGGGNGSAKFNTDFVELHNRSNSPVSLKGWSLQRASASGAWQNNTSQLIPFPDAATIPAGGYYLVAGKSGGTGAALPTPDLSASTFDLGAGSAKVALVPSTDLLSGTTTGACTSTATAIDVVSYGSGATCAEGGTPAPAPGDNVASVFRKGYGCTDTNANDADFTVSPAFPHNSASTPAFCGCNDVINNETDAAVEADYCKIFTTTLTSGVNTTTAAITGELFEGGTTDASDGPGLFLAQVAVAPAGTSLTSGGAWAFFDAGYTSRSGNNYQYSATVPTPAATGNYDLLYRISLDGKKTWTYCDKDGAGSNPSLSLDNGQRANLTAN
jgi:hypothetical protein